MMAVPMCESGMRCRPFRFATSAILLNLEACQSNKEESACHKDVVKGCNFLLFCLLMSWNYKFSNACPKDIITEHSFNATSVAVEKQFQF